MSINSRNGAKRILEFDTMRSLCMLWIVGVWHLSDYINISTKSKSIIINDYTDLYTVGILVCFTFLSGYFCQGEFTGKKDVISFYIKKLKRFYPLYLVACIGMYTASVLTQTNLIAGVEQLISTCLGLNMFVCPYPVTIWYFGMMIFFYAITPIFNLIKRKRDKIISAVIIYGFIMGYMFINGDNRILIYYPVYCFAVIFGDKIRFNKRFNKGQIFLVFGLTVLSTVLMMHICILLSNPIYMVLLCGMVCGYAIYLLADLLTGIYSIQLFSAISYSSMCAYLFHRLYFGAIKFLMGDFNIWVAIGIILPTFIVISYVIQRYYDKIVDSMCKIRRDIK